MAKRVSLPPADDLFRPTAEPEPPGPAPARPRATRSKRARQTETGSGRIRHEEKMTVYVTAEELLAIEQARLQLRGEHGIAVDRGRLVREAVAIALADLASDGAESTLARRLDPEAEAR